MSHVPELEYVIIIGGVLVDGDGWAFIDGHWVHIGPRGPELQQTLKAASALSQAARIADEQGRGAELHEMVGRLLTMVSAGVQAAVGAKAGAL